MKIRETEPIVGLVMGSKSDWKTMQLASGILDDFEITHERLVVSAHRTPKWMFKYADEAEQRGLKVIIAGAGGAAHLPGMLASLTTLPVFGVPIQSRSLSGLDSLLSIVQMPGGVPVGALAIGEAGAKNAALLAIRVLAIESPDLRQRLRAYSETQTNDVMENIKL